MDKNNSENYCDNATLSDMNAVAEVTSPRLIIVSTMILILGLATFPWFSGGQDGVIRFIVAGLLMLAAVLAWRQPSFAKLKSGTLTLSYTLFVAWTGLSLLWSVNRYETVMWLALLVLAGVVFRLTYAVSDGSKVRAKLENIYLIGVAIFVAYAIYLYLTGAYDRLTGWFYWANPAAAYLMPAIIIAWGRMNGRRLWLWSALVSVFLMAFFLADSRGATLVLFLLFIPILLMQSHNKTTRTLLVFSLLIGYLLSLGCVQLRHITVHSGLASAPGSRFAEAAVGESRSVKDRLNYLGSSFDIWFAHPLFGTGGGTFATVHPKYQKTVVSASTSAHNIYAQTLAEEGIVGAGLLAWFIFILLGGLARTIWREPARTSIAFGAIALLLHFGLDIDASYPPLVFLLAMFAGLSYRQRKESHGKLSLRVPAFALAAMVVIMGSFQSGANFARGVAAQDERDYPTASAWFEQAHSGLTYDPDTLNAEGIDYYSEAIFGEKGAGALALDRARNAIEQDPEDSQHYQLEGRVLQLQKDNKGAEAAFRMALNKDPYNHPDYAGDLAQLLIARGKSAEAQKVVEAMLKQYPEEVVKNRNADVSLHTNFANLEGILAQLKLNAGDRDGAKASVVRGLKLNPTNLRCRSVEHELNAT
ncbi:MAG: O-antigen ligase family protein [Candidatus Saccharibacteria bacterium]